jgi:apolipoprotein N-acyltransferase
MINSRNTFLYAILSALLLTLSWFYGLTAFIFIAFTPLLLLENYFSVNTDIRRKKTKFIGLTYLSFLLWNIGVTWWVWNASAGGALMAILANSLLMTIVFVTFSNVKNKLNKIWAIWLLIPIWIAWEHIHTLWDITWPWLALGNVLSYKPNWIQWFEYTGTSGGTLWILLVNIILFKLITATSFAVKQTYKPLTAILLPILFSYIVLFTHKNTSSLKEQNIVVVQPNIDPYNEKFDTEFDIQFQSVLKQIEQKITSETNYLVLPETFVIDNINEEFIDRDVNLQLFKDSLLSKFPNLNIITGVNSYRFYQNNEKPSATARKDESSGHFYDVYNTGLQLNNKGITIYHKSKLVPGVELMPFPALLKPLESLAIDMGGTMGSLGIQANRTVFTGNENIKVAPVICYESVYGDYVTEYIRNGANFIFIITNDGWWDNTPGHKQHLSYARLRAIETRRCIARSANTGISCFIDETGAITQATNWWEKAVIEAKLKPNDQLTIFVRFGDILSKISVTLSALILAYYWFLRFFKR